ncbi:MAG: hypothetical protein QOE92_1771 [Chloroflexota bacterium]|jgi:hypothetical protein|nr:hypothetical protein [Chloroflexota bacterium]
MSPTADLESRISELESTIEGLRSKPDTAKVGRRRLLRLAAAAAGGGAVAPLLLNTTASASTGDVMCAGCTTIATTDTTIKQNNDENGNSTAFIVGGSGRLAQSPLGTSGAPTNAGKNYEQVRDANGTLFLHFGGGVWAGAMVAGDGVGIFEDKVTTQPSLSNSDGVTWQAMGVLVDITPEFKCNLLCTANADLWTNTAGYNQDLAIFISGGVFGTPPGTLVSWKESGGFAGTFSPNAAAVQGIIRNLQPATAYRVQLRWKTNKPAGGVTIFAGAGPISGQFSPTRLVVQLLPR